MGVVYAACCALTYIAHDGEAGLRAVVIGLVFAVGSMEASKILGRP